MEKMRRLRDLCTELGLDWQLICGLFMEPTITSMLTNLFTPTQRGRRRLGLTMTLFRLKPGQPWTNLTAVLILWFEIGEISQIIVLDISCWETVVFKLGLMEGVQVSFASRAAIVLEERFCSRNELTKYGWNACNLLNRFYSKTCVRRQLLTEDGFHRNGPIKREWSMQYG